MLLSLVFNGLWARFEGWLLPIQNNRLWSFIVRCNAWRQHNAVRVGKTLVLRTVHDYVRFWMLIGNGCTAVHDHKWLACDFSSLLLGLFISSGSCGFFTLLICSLGSVNHDQNTASSGTRLSFWTVILFFRRAIFSICTIDCNLYFATGVARTIWGLFPALVALEWEIF